MSAKSDNIVKRTFNEQNQCHSYDDKPALIMKNGSKFWYKNDRLHRDGDKPAYIAASGTKHWYRNSRLHRIGKPAVIMFTGALEYYVRGTQLIGNDIPKTEADWIILVLKLAQSYYE